MSIYCVYVTFYRGNKLPPFYIGSTSLERINSGYRGSVRSKEYRKIWESEIRNNPNLFCTRIISSHINRSSATEKECSLQKMLGVVKNSLYVNKATATKNGYFGSNVSGELNPNYGKRWSKDQKNSASKRVSSIHLDIPRVWINNEKTSRHIDKNKINDYLSKGWVLGRKMKVKNIIERGKTAFKSMNQIKICCLECRQEIQAHTLNTHTKKHTTGIEYFGKIYTSIRQLKSITNCSRYLYQKLYLKGYDPRPSIGNNNIHHIPQKIQ